MITLSVNNIGGVFTIQFYHNNSLFYVKRVKNRKAVKPMVDFFEKLYYTVGNEVVVIYDL